MSKNDKVKATKLSVGLPFNLGQIEFEPDGTEIQAAWELYVELSTRITVQPLNNDEGRIREAMTSIYNVFNITRDILRRSGPAIGKGDNSLGKLAIDILNKGLRPFLAKWHPLLQAYEETKPSHISSLEHEKNWEHAKQFREELYKIQNQMQIYVDILAKIAGVIGDK